MSSSPSRESELVELVDADGTAVGSATVDEAHRAPGRLHRAFSIFLRDPAGRVLLQQRAAVKTRFPLRWANTCCGHPYPGEDVRAAAARRLAEEIGVSGAELSVVGVYPYYAEDPDTGRVEYEYDHVLVGDMPPGAVLRPDPAEVADTRWVEVPELVAALAADPRSYSPWLPGVTEQLAAAAGPPAATPASPSAASPSAASPSAVSPSAASPSASSSVSSSVTSSGSSSVTSSVSSSAAERSGGR